MTAFHATCGTTDFPELCSECREPKTWRKIGKGKAAKRTLVCETCEPVVAAEPVVVSAATLKPKVAHKNRKAKGRRGEKAAEKEWEAWGFDAQSTVGSGAAGSRAGEKKFDTDVVIRHGRDFTAGLESKRHSKLPIASLVGLMGRSELLRLEVDADEAKARNYPTTTYYFMSRDVLGVLAKWAAEGMRAAKGRAQ